MENAVLTAGTCKDLRVYKTLVQDSIDAGDIFADKSFKPALCLGAIERVARIGRERMTIEFELLDEFLEGGHRGQGEFFARIRVAEENASIVPACKQQASKTQQNLARLHVRMHCDGTGRERNDRIE